MAIAANYRQHADALIRQMELDLAGAADACTRAAWWTWLMEAGRPQALVKPEAPAWFKAARRVAVALALRVKTACMGLFQHDRV